MLPFPTDAIAERMTGSLIDVSAAPAMVPLPYDKAAAVDPGKAFVVALAVYYMLCFQI